MAKIKFPHFTLEEAKVLEEFQKRFPYFTNWRYDVKLKSRKLDLAKIDDPILKKMWYHLTAKRIDAVCEDNENIYIIEVKRYMMASGIGQLLVYQYMFNEQFKPKKNIKLWLISYYPDPDVEHIANQLGIRTWSVKSIE